MELLDIYLNKKTKNVYNYLQIKKKYDITIKMGC